MVVRTVNSDNVYFGHLGHTLSNVILGKYLFLRFHWLKFEAKKNNELNLLLSSLLRNTYEQMTTTLINMRCSDWLSIQAIENQL